VDRRLSLREILEKVFGLIPAFKSKDELLDDEFEKLVADLKPEAPEMIVALRYFFKAYITDENVRKIIEQKRYAELNNNATFTMQDFQAVPRAWRAKIPEYVKDYVSLNQFME